MSYSDRIAKAIDREGELVAIEDYSSKVYSKWGDLQSQTTSNLTAIKTIFNQYGKSANYQTEGVFQEGDVSFFFKSDQTGVENHNVIVRANSERWKIVQVATHYARGSITHIEAKATQE